jgi:hypothetical protein
MKVCSALFELNAGVEPADVAELAELAAGLLTCEATTGIAGMIGMA